MTKFAYPLMLAFTTVITDSPTIESWECREGFVHITTPGDDEGHELEVCLWVQEMRDDNDQPTDIHPRFGWNPNEEPPEKGWVVMDGSFVNGKITFGFAYREPQPDEIAEIRAQSQAINQALG